MKSILTPSFVAVQNNFYMEKNPTIVTFPVKNLELRDYLNIASELGLPRLKKHQTLFSH